jgi:hypothetical protein
MDSGRPSISGVGSQIASRAVPGTKPRGPPRPGAEEERTVAVARSVASPVAGVDVGIVGCGRGPEQSPLGCTKVDDPERVREEGQNGPFKRARDVAGPAWLRGGGEDEGSDRAGQEKDGP